MKLWILSGIIAIATVSTMAEAGTVRDPTVAERQRSVETGLCVVREDQEVTARMLAAEGGTAIQNRFMILIKKCAENGTTLFPNVVMGAAAEKILADRNFSVDKLMNIEKLPNKVLDNTTNRLFACAVTSKPMSLIRILQTSVGSQEEIQAIQDFQLALINCDATRGGGVTPVNIRASAARTAFAMASGMQ